MKDFIGVDIADARHKALVEEQALYGGPAGRPYPQVKAQAKAWAYYLEGGQPRAAVLPGILAEISAW